MKTLKDFVCESIELSEEEKSYKKDYEELLSMAKEKSTAKRIIGSFQTWDFENLQYIKFDALEEKDVPSNIAENSVFIKYSIDFRAKKVDILTCGSVWLSKADLATDKYRLMAMKSINNVYVQGGNYNPENPKVNTKFRKQSFKSVEDLYKKMETYYENVMKAVDEYTGGYPYKTGK